MMDRLWLRGLAATASAAVLLLGSAGAGYAGGPGTTSGGGGGGSTTDTAGTAAGNSDAGSTYSGREGGCHIVSTSQTLSSVCPGGAQDTASIKKIMGGEKFKECWETPMTAEEIQATSHDPYGDAVPYMKRCLHGIDPKTLAVTGPIWVEEIPEWLYPPYTHIDIGPNQTKLLEFADHSIPYPIAVVSPTGQPRVGQWVSFYDAQPDQRVGDNGDHQVVVNTLGVRLVAQEDRIVVQPRGLNIAESISCPSGGHRADVGEKGVEGGNCWYRYQRSSAGQPDNKYPVRITAYWTVYVETGGTRRQINAFQKSVTTQLPVTEIQAINVS